MIKVFISLFIGLLGACAGRVIHQDAKELDAGYEQALQLLAQMAGENRTFEQLLEEHFTVYNVEPELTMPAYDCKLDKSSTPPISAHAVRPGDINVIGAIGDSITAGWGITANNIFEVIKNDRHLAWVSGATKSLDERVVTLPNILRKFNPGVTGYSYAESWPADREAGLNVAVGGQTATAMGDQTKKLIKKMKDTEYGVDWHNDWKLISLLIGGNDLCRWCLDQDYYSPEMYVSNIQRALDIMYAEIPRAIVIVTGIFDITPLPAFSDGLICDVFQTFACNCAKRGSQQEGTSKQQKRYIARLEQLINSGRYDRGRKDFTVVWMPHFNEALPPTIPGTDEPDRGFFAPDCFHPGRKAHFALATSLWNQLFEPVGQKRTSFDWQIGTNLHCPTEDDPYIKTRLNSRK